MDKQHYRPETKYIYVWFGGEMSLNPLRSKRILFYQTEIFCYYFWLFWSHRVTEDYTILVALSYMLPLLFNSFAGRSFPMTTILVVRGWQHNPLNFFWQLWWWEIVASGNQRLRCSGKKWLIALLTLALQLISVDRMCVCACMRVSVCEMSLSVLEEKGEMKCER